MYTVVASYRHLRNTNLRGPVIVEHVEAHIMIGLGFLGNSVAYARAV